MICLQVLEHAVGVRDVALFALAWRTWHPDAAAGQGGGAAELRRLLDDEGVESRRVGGERRGHAATAGPDHKHVDGVVELIRGHGVSTAVRIGEARDQFGRRPVKPLLRLIPTVRGHRRECSDPRSDFVRRVAGLLLDPTVRPGIDLGEPIGVEQLEKGVVPVGVEGLKRSLPVGELACGVHDRDLPRLSLLGCHRLAVHDPVQCGRWSRGQCRHRRIMGQPTGSDDENPLAQRRQVRSDRST